MSIEKQFLRKGLSLADIAKEGSFVTVRELEKYPELSDIKSEGQSQKFVIKDYSEADLSQLFDGRNFSHVQQASILRARQEFTKNLYDQLPNLVVESKFFVAEGSYGEPTVYELQPLISNHKNTSLEFNQDKKSLKKELLGSFSKEQLIILETELTYFIIKTREFLKGNWPKLQDPQKLSGFFLDIAAGNLVITPDGHLKVIDTNKFHDLSFEDNTRDAYEYSVGDLEIILESVREMLKLTINEHSS